MFFEKLFDFCVKYKLSAIARGEETPVMDKVVFKAARDSIGGRVRVIFSGGAPLSPSTHDYLKVGD